MRTDDARRIVHDALALVAPDADLESADPAAELQVALDLDSIDFLNIVTAVSTRIGYDIPERDYAELITLDGFVRYVAGHAAVSQS